MPGIVRRVYSGEIADPEMLIGTLRIDWALGAASGPVNTVVCVVVSLDEPPPLPPPQPASASTARLMTRKWLADGLFTVVRKVLEQIGAAQHACRATRAGDDDRRAAVAEACEHL